MLILGITLTILGFIVFKWTANAQSKSFLDRPMMFNNAVVVLIIHLLWLGLFIGGLYSLWQVNPVIDLVIFALFGILWIIGYSTGGEKSRAKKIFSIYKQLKLFRPKVSEQEILIETAKTYYSSLRWDERRIKVTVETIFEKTAWSKENKDVKEVASSILMFENPRDDLRRSFDFKKFSKRSAKTQKAIDSAYSSIFGKAQKVTKRPILSRGTIDWLKSAGLDPAEMSDEQLATFAEIDDQKKSTWPIRFLYGTSFIFLLLGGINLISLDIGGVILNVIISFVLWFVGNKIQMRRVNKKFHEASIMKYAQEQTGNDR